MSSKKSKKIIKPKVQTKDADDLAELNVDDLIEKELKAQDGNVDEAVNTGDEEADAKTDELFNRLQEIRQKLNDFCFSFCSLVADIIITVESSAYTLISSNKIDGTTTSELADPKNEVVIFLLSHIMEDVFNSVLHAMQKKKRNPIIKRIKNLSMCLPHSRFCILQMLARKSMELLLTLPRQNFLTDSDKSYSDSIIKYVNKSLREKMEKIPNMILEFCDDTCDDSMITDKQYKGKKIFEFETVVE